MKKDTLLKTNCFICVIIILGFIAVAVVSYRSNNGIFKKDVEQISSLTSEGIYHNIDSIFAKPINISLTMANDSLLKDFLAQETEKTGDDAFVQTMRDYLSAYQQTYQYDSVFLVSTKTNHYYHFDGVDRTLAPDNPENVWYYSFLNGPDDCSPNVDNDEAAQNEVTVFINGKIKDADGQVMGVVGVGFKVNYLQAIFGEYENDYAVKAFLVDSAGTIQLSTDQTGYEAVNLFSQDGYGGLRDDLALDSQSERNFWYNSPTREGYIVSRYIPNMNWTLIIDNNITPLRSQMRLQLVVGMLVVLLVIGLVLLLTTRIIRRYNARIVSLTLEREKKHTAIFKEETQKIYENIYEIDITHDRAASDATQDYFESLGVPRDTASYATALTIIAEKQIKAEYREGYLSTFGPEQVLRAYHDGLEKLRYELMITKDGGKSYYWMRITAQIFLWEEDQSVRMFVYRQNIDDEKQHEKYMSDKMKRDALTGLYNKVAAQEQVSQWLTGHPDAAGALFIVDIDDFKQVNDTFGHAIGDVVISRFAEALKAQFRPGDVVGRIGGDEFLVFIPAATGSMVRKKAEALVSALRFQHQDGDKTVPVSASIGVALCPEAGQDFYTLYKNADVALYEAKAKGKNRCQLYQ
ncbi:sensor domain-containing diguanylate cyclase [Eubacterium sp. 1001713B170207_170306_E7]|uniref:sensor domain-containing diguanylate cyclase n=1 Tax=Eubacterium sp. 1001713B170207_170306_E7 TaxID=2787097 RepID=UPI001898C081|nr:sensor domain-containing diguanylate cyclase [Eubacterium sp. 1001713B170207_170306_E7]